MLCVARIFFMQGTAEMDLLFFCVVLRKALIIGYRLDASIMG